MIAHSPAACALIPSALTPCALIPCTLMLSLLQPGGHPNEQRIHALLAENAALAHKVGLGHGVLGRASRAASAAEAL